jgi:hypothetical protein
VQIKYKKTDLEIYTQNQKLNFDINKDIDIDFIREQFNSTIGKLSEKHNSLEYWLMRLSERNTLVHNLFIDICRISFLKSLSKQYEDIKVYTNNVAIYIYFSSNAIVSLNDRLIFEGKRFLLINKPYLKGMKFLLKKFIFSINYKNKTKANTIKKATIIQTWVSDGNFKDDGFKDSYYGNLAKYLKEQDKKVITWPVFYNVKNEAKAVKFIRKHNDEFVLIEDYLKPIDYMESIKHFIKKRFLNLGKITLGDDDFTKVFRYYQKKESVEMVSLFYCFCKRLSEKGSENITFIQHHENMIPEKALILGARQYLPNSKIVGYFHTTKPKNILCLDYASYEEYKIAPKPDAIIFNSDKYKKYYENKYSNLPMFNGMAFKQKHLQNSGEILNKFSDEILVLFSGTTDEIKLMFILLNQISNDYKFIFRMHPMNQFDVKKYYSKKNYKIVNNESLDESLSKVNKVISTYSAVALESALKGYVVGLVYNKKELLLNPFDFTDVHNYSLISNFVELDEFLKEEFKMNKVEQIFNVDEEFYKIFNKIGEEL